MKRLRSMLCLLLCSTFLLVDCSKVFASNTETDFSLSHKLIGVSFNDLFGSSDTYSSGSGGGLEIISKYANYDRISYVKFCTTITKSDNSTMFLADYNYQLKIDNIFTEHYVTYNGVDTSINITPYDVALQIFYKDGTSAILDYSSSDALFSDTYPHLHSYSFNLTFSKDVSSIILVERFYTPHSSVPSAGTYVYGTFSGGSLAVGVPITVTSIREDKEVGLLGGIWDTLSGGFSDMLDSLTSGFDSVVGGLSDLLDSIIELPQKLWQLIEDGLKNLFVPDEQYIIDYKDKWDSLLAEHLGAVYQVVSILTESWDNIASADENNTINIPLVTIPLLDSDTFSFGGYDVQIVPAGFEGIADTCKFIIGIVCSVAFVNGLRLKYEEFVS